MNLGIIGYANASGHGMVCASLKEVLPEMSQLIVQHSLKDEVEWYCPHQDDWVSIAHVEPPDGKPKPYSIPGVSDLERWLHTAKPDVVMFLEFPFNWDFLPMLRKRGIKIAMMPLLDCYPLYAYKHIDMIDAWLAPTDVAYDYLKPKFDNVYRLNVPIDINRFAFKERGAGRHFLHNAGYGGSGARKNTGAVCDSFLELKKELPDARLTVNVQVAKVKLSSIHGYIDFNIRNVENPESIYEGDIFVYPSTAEGIGLQILEAMSCGFPVITTDWSPMKEYVLIKQLLIDCSPPPEGQALHGRCRLDTRSLTDRMRYAARNDLKEISHANRRFIEKFYSYRVLRPLYLEVFNKILKGAE